MPPRNEDLTSPSTEPGYTINDKEPISCERCKSRKLKCGRQRPACHRCTKIDAACTYTGRRKPGFPAGQRQLLEDKIRRLESELQKSRDQAGKSSELASPQTYPRPESGDLAIVSRDSTLPPIATLEKTRRLVEKEPPADLAFSATSLFFRHVHSWLPFLDTQRVFSDMALLRNPPPLYYALFGVSIPYSHDPRLDRKSSDSFWTYSKRKIFVDILEEPSLKALESLTILVLDLSGMTNGPQVWGALSIAVKFSVQLEYVGSRVFRTSAEHHMDQALSSGEETHRRRLFWAIYALDSYITITTGHPSDLGACHIQYFLPSRNETWREPPGSNFAGEGTGWRLENNQNSLPVTANLIFSYQLELLDISRDVHAMHLERPTVAAEPHSFHWAQSFLSCSTKLFEWFQNLPQYLGLNYEGNQLLSVGRVPPTLVMLHAYYHALVLHLHGLAAYPPDEASHALSSEYTVESRRRCTDSIASLCTMISRLEKKFHDRLGWPFTWAICITCRYILVRNRSEGLNDMSSFYVLLECLKTSTRYWQIGGKYWSLLSQAAAEFAAGQLSEGGSTPVRQDILLAMTDLRIPISDLEDQARPDPIVCATLVAQENNVEMTEMMSSLEGNSQTRMGGFGGPVAEDTFNMSSQVTSDYWYSSLLFSSSGYQQ